MKIRVNRPRSFRPAVHVLLLQGVAFCVAGLIQANVVLMIVGVVAIVLSVAALVITTDAVAMPVLHGEIVGRQQPQLTDVQVRTHRTPELAQVP